MNKTKSYTEWSGYIHDRNVGIKIKKWDKKKKIHSKEEKLSNEIVWI